MVSTIFYEIIADEQFKIIEGILPWNMTP